MKTAFCVLVFALMSIATTAQEATPTNEISVNILGLTRLEYLNNTPKDVTILETDESDLILNSYNPYRRTVPLGIGYKRKLGDKNLYLRTGFDFFKTQKSEYYWNLRPIWPFDVNYNDTMLTERYKYEYRTFALRIGLEKRKQIHNLIIRGGADVLYTYTAANYNYFETVTIKNTVGMNNLALGEPISPPLEGTHKKSNSMIGIMPNWGIDVVATNRLIVGAEMSITAMFNQGNEFKMREDKLYSVNAPKFAFNVYPAFCGLNVTYMF